MSSEVRREVTNLSEVTKLDKIYYYYGNVFQSKRLLSANLLFTQSAVRTVTSRNELIRCLQDNKRIAILCRRSRKYKRNCNVILDDELINKAMPRFVLFGENKEIFYGKFSYATLKKYEKYNLYPIEMTSDLEDNLEYVFKKTFLHGMKLTNYPFRLESINIILRGLSKYRDQITKLWPRLNHIYYVCKQLIINNYVNPQYLIDTMQGNDDLKNINLRDEMFKNKRFDLMSFLKKNHMYGADIILILNSPVLTDEIFLHIKTIIDRYYFCIYDVVGIYQTLSLNVLLENFNQLNVILMYKYKNHIIKKPGYYFSIWYDFPEFRDEFIKVLSTNTIRDNFSYYSDKYAEYVVKHINLNEEIIKKISSHVTMMTKLAKIYKNPTITVDIIHLLYKYCCYDVNNTWFLTKYIPIKDICDLLRLYKHRTQLTYIYNRVDLPFNLLVYLTDGKLSRKACKNIYITKDLIAEYNIKPSFILLRKNMFHLDPRYIKQPSHTVEI